MTTQARPASDIEGTEQPQHPKKKPKVASVSAVHGLAESTQGADRSHLAKGSASHKKQHAAKASTSLEAQDASNASTSDEAQKAATGSISQEAQNAAKATASREPQNAAQASTSQEAQHPAAVLAAASAEDQARGSSQGAQNGSKVRCVDADDWLLRDSGSSITLEEENRQQCAWYRDIRLSVLPAQCSREQMVLNKLS